LAGEEHSRAADRPTLCSLGGNDRVFLLSQRPTWCTNF